MTGSSAVPRFLTHPAEVIAELVAAVEPSLDPGAVVSAVGGMTVNLGQQRRLARALFEDPGLLTSGRPEGPPTVAQLIGVLQRQGARNLTLPACASCGRVAMLTQRDAKGRRICAACDVTARQAAKPVLTCTACGNTRRAAYRDRAGRALCRYCPPERGMDHTAEIIGQIRRVDPDLAEADLRAVVERAVPLPAQRMQLAWDLEARPGLLTGAGVEGSTRLAVLIEELVLAGARIQPLACGFCGQARRLRLRREQRLCCKGCYYAVRTEKCSRCGRQLEVASRDLDGRPLCHSCTRREPQNLGQCSRCGRVRPLSRRHGQALCRNCNCGDLAVCSRCGQEKYCYKPGSATPVCANCHRWLKAEPCSRCGRQRQVAGRAGDGQALCGQCARRKEVCAGCNTRKEVSGRTENGPLCATCYAKDPVLVPGVRQLRQPGTAPPFRPVPALRLPGSRARHGRPG